MKVALSLSLSLSLSPSLPTAYTYFSPSGHVASPALCFDVIFCDLSCSIISSLLADAPADAGGSTCDCCGADKYVDPANELNEWEQPKQYEGTKVR